MYEWNENQQMMREVMRDFVEKEIAPNIEDLEHGDTPPYEVLRKLYATFGLDTMAAQRFDNTIERLEAEARGETVERPRDKDRPQGSDTAAMAMVPIIELCRYSPGLVTAMGVSVGLTASAIMSKGTLDQKKKWAKELLTLEKVGAWAITEPESGSDAFGSMKATARRDGDEFVINGNKTFITNGPYADTIVFYAKLDEGNPPEDRQVVAFILDKDDPGLERTRPMRKMGLHSSPTGELFLSDVRVGMDRLLGGEGILGDMAGSRKEAKSSFTMERSGVAAMALGIIEQCLEKSLAYAKERQSWGKPIADYQLIQLKLAKMEVARLNVQNLVYRHIEMATDGKDMTFAEASAMKLYSAQAAVEVALEAVQLFGGNGYMAEYQVEQLARDAKILQIYAGTDEMQVVSIAKDLLSR